MLWVDGTPTLYDGYQDLGLLEPTTTNDKNVIAPGMERDKKNKLGEGGNRSRHSSNSGGSPLSPPPITTTTTSNNNNNSNIGSSNKGEGTLSPPPPTTTTTLEPTTTNTNDKEDQTNQRTNRSRSSSRIEGTFSLPSTTTSPSLPLQPMSQPFLPIDRAIPLDRGILTITMDPLCEYFVTLTMSSVELWAVKPTMLLCQVTRSTDSVVSEGAYVSISWKSDSRAFCAFTTRGYLYFYHINVKDGVFPKLTTNHGKGREMIDEEGYGTLGSGLSEDVHPTSQANPHSLWIRNPGRYFSLELAKVVHVDRGVRCIISHEDEVLVATPNNASILNYSWKDKVMLGSLHLAQDANFLDPTNVMVNQMLYDPLQGLFVWLTTDGSVYLVRRKISFNVFASGSPYDWQGTSAHHCDGDPETYATMISLNPRHYLIAAVMRNNQICIFSYGKSGMVVRPSHQFKVASQVTCLAWSDSGDTLAVGTATKGLQLYGVYNCVPDLTTAQGRFGFGTSTDPDDDPYSLCVHWLCWSAGDQDLLVVANTSTFQKGKFYSLPICRAATISQMTDDNVRHPTLFSASKITLDFFVQTEHGSINPNAMSHSTQIPHTYGLDNMHMRYISRSGDGLLLAVAGRRGLAHYSCISQKWKLFNNHTQEQSLQCVGGMVWYRNTLIVGCKLMGTDGYFIKFFPRERNLDLANVICSLDLPSKPCYLNLVDRWLLVYSRDNLLAFYDIATDSNGRISSVTLAQKISLEGVVKIPPIVRAITWFPADLRQSFPKMVILMAGTLLLFTPDVDSAAGLPKYRISQIADKVNHFQILDLSLAGLQFSLWAYCNDIVKIWYQLAEVPGIFGAESTTDPDPSPTRAFDDPQIFQVPFHPLTLDLKQGLMFGVEQSMYDSPTIPGLFFSPAFKSHVLFHPILDRLVSHHLDQEAYLFGLHFEPYPYFGYGLEILLHDVLVREVDLDPKEGEATLPRAVALIRQFPHFPEVVVSCARKIEAALWDQLFQAVGPPIHLFDQCLAAHRHDAAASYLIVLHTLATPTVSADASRRLLQLAIRDRNLDLFHNVARFIARLKNTTDPSFLTPYLTNNSDDDLVTPTTTSESAASESHPRPQSARDHLPTPTTPSPIRRIPSE